MVRFSSWPLNIPLLDEGHYLPGLRIGCWSKRANYGSLCIVTAKSYSLLVGHRVDSLALSLCVIDIMLTKVEFPFLCWPRVWKEEEFIHVCINVIVALFMGLHVISEISIVWVCWKYKGCYMCGTCVCFLGSVYHQQVLECHSSGLIFVLVPSIIGCH